MASKAIAVTGIACRLPGGVGSPEDLWRLLARGGDATGLVPDDRWINLDLPTDGDPPPRFGAFLTDIKRFDAVFFGVSPREAEEMDPQQRLALELAHTAMEDAGIAPASLNGSRTGVFIGAVWNDYAIAKAMSQRKIVHHTATAEDLSVIPARISFAFGLRGPSLAINSACSSSLVALHLACQSLRSGETRLALAGGVNLILNPRSSRVMSELRVLSPDGKCRAFDRLANGYVRGEGAAIVVLKLLTQALDDGDRIYCVIRGSAVNNDGWSNLLVAPSQEAQELLLRDALKAAGVPARRIDYVEAHGAGTPLGDEVEACALGEVLGRAPGRRRPLVIGSVKTNIGHLEAAAGVAGLIKVALAFRHSKIPRSLHFENPNPKVPFNDLNLSVADHDVDWPQGRHIRHAGISGFGYGGTNCHLILEEAPKLKSRAGFSDGRPMILPVSAKTESALRQHGANFAEFLDTSPDSEFGNVARLAASRRDHHEWRIAIAAASGASAASQIRAILKGNDSLIRCASSNGDVVFVFPGQGSQWLGMGRELLLSEPVFRAKIRECDEAIRSVAGWSVEAAFQAAPDEALFDSITTVQPVLFAVSAALAAVWQSWGVRPAAVIGHSQGEVTAAYVAGALNLRDAARIVCRRSEAVARLAGRGAMALAEASESNLRSRLDTYGRVWIAGSNSATSTIVAGEPTEIDRLVRELEKEQIFCRRIRVDIASHTPEMDGVSDEILHALETIRPSEGKIPIQSTTTGLRTTGVDLDANYWVRNLRQPVQFYAGIKSLIREGSCFFVEISPHPLLVSAITSTISEQDSSAVAVSSLQRDAPERLTLLRSLAALYMSGYQVHWDTVYKDEPCHMTSLPTYPFQGKQFWAGGGARDPNSLRGSVSRSAVEGWVEQIRDRSISQEEALALLEDIREDEDASSCAYEIGWQEIPLAQSEGTTKRHWIVLADDSEVASYITAALERIGPSKCIRPGDLNLALSELRGGAIGPAGIVNLSSVASRIQDPQESVCRAVRTSAAILREIACLPNPPRYWEITRGAVPFENYKVDLTGASLVGFGRVAALEYPEVWGGGLDLPHSQDDFRAAIVQLIEELTTSGSEPQVAFRGGRRFCPRLRTLPITSSGQDVWNQASEGGVLITGGLGQIGLQLAENLAAEGIRHIALVSRSASADQHSLDRIRRHGVNLCTYRADVASESELCEVLRSVDRDLPPLTGVIHAAGVFQRQKIEDLAEESLYQVTRPKVAGSWNLHSLTLDRNLSFFVVFSSATSVWGAAESGAYAAANAFMDGLVHLRRAQGLPALSLNWGSWSRGGVLNGTHMRFLEERGMRPLGNTRAFRILSHLLSGKHVQATVAEIDWPRFREIYEASRRQPLFAGLPGEPEQARPEEVPIASRISDQMLRETLRQELGRILRLEPGEIGELSTSQSFFRSGLDSITAVKFAAEIQRILKVKVPPSLIFAHSSIEALACYLSRLIQGAAPSLVAARPRVSKPSSAQQRLWFLDRILRQRAVYNVHIAIEMEGKLDTEALRRSLTFLIARHDLLRASFPENNGEPLLNIGKPFECVLPETDLRHLSASEREKTLESIQAAEAELPFDLGVAPLWRTRLLQLNDRLHILLVTQHHIITDGWSLRVLLEELHKTYTAFTSGVATPFTSPAPQISEYAFFEADSCADERRKSCEYWRQKLAGLPELVFPWDRFRTRRSSNRGNKIRFTVPAETLAKADAIAKHCESTVFTVLLTAFATEIYRYSDQFDFAIGTFRSQRDHPDWHGLLSMQTNTEAWRFDFSGSPTFRDMLLRTKQVSDEARLHQDVPFDEAVRLSGVARQGADNPLFRVCFAQQLPLPKFDFQGGKWTARSITFDGGPEGLSKFDLHLTIAGHGTQIEGELQYRNDFLDAESAHLLVSHFLLLTDRLLSNPQIPVGAIPILGSEEAKLRTDRNRTARLYVGPKRVDHAIEQQASKTPEAIAVRFGPQQRTYAELNARANRIANFFQSVGIRPGSMVGVLMERSLELPEVLLAIFKSNCSYVPLDPRYPQARLEFMVANARIDVLITNREWQGPKGVPTINVESRASSIGSQPANNPGCRETWLAYLLYTSGSSGRPKGVLISHSALMNALNSLVEITGLSPTGNFAALTSLSFDISAFELFGPLICGACVTVASVAASESLMPMVEMLNSESITMAQATPTLWRMLLDYGWQPRAGLSILSGGETLAPELARALRSAGGPCWNLYGPTETTIWSTGWPIPDDCDFVVIGEPLANTQLHILNSYMEPVPDGIEGELYIGGAGLADGYWSDPRLTAERFLPNPFSESCERLYRTGDRVVRTRKGIEFIGRVDHQVKLRGFRIELGEIECALRKYPGVRDAVVTVREDTRGEPRLVAYIVHDSWAPGSADARLRTEMSSILPPHMVPADFFTLHALPLLPSGKVDYQALPSPPSTAATDEATVLVSDLENTIARLFGEILGQGQVDPSKPFFDLGGTSLGLIRLQRCIERELRRDLDPILLLNYPTVHELASYLSGALPSSCPLPTPTREHNESIAVIGIGCRFPGAIYDAETFWERITSGVDAISEVPPSRWDVDRLYAETPAKAGKLYTRSAGILPDVDWFDAEFFGLTSQEAIMMDPQQRLLLEVSWEALEHAGISPFCLRGSPTGVFIGIAASEYAQRSLWSDPQSVNAWAGLGGHSSVAAGRISYCLKLKGPSMAIDTACSSSLVAVHLACQSLRGGEASIALAGGVNLLLDPRTSIALCQMEALSPTGRCRPFSDVADGYVRADGCGIVVLKRLADAEAAHDRILAIIRSTSVNHDGGGASFTAPNGLSQQEVISKALEGARLPPGAVQYVEAHGTGTILGDPVEVVSLANAYGKDRKRGHPLLIGSIKSNFGHAEAAAGIAGLIKTVLALHHGEIPATLHAGKLNRLIPWGELPIEVVRERRKWPKVEGIRFAAVSSFGMSGTNSHAILAQALPSQPAVLLGARERPLHILAFSARNETSLRLQARRFADSLENHPEYTLADFCYSVNTTRAHHSVRCAIVSTSRSELLPRLRAVAAGTPVNEGVYRITTTRNLNALSPEIVFPKDESPELWTKLVTSIAQSYANGVDVDWQAFDAPYSRSRVDIPAYAFDKQRYWIEAPDTSANFPAAIDNNLLYRSVWREHSENGNQSRDCASGLWIILGNDAVATRLGETLGTLGGTCRMLTGDRCNELETILTDSSLPPRGVIYVAGLRDLEGGRSGAEEVARASRDLADSALSFSRAIIQHSISTRLWLLTRGAMALNDSQPVSVVQSVLWGIGAVLDLEHPSVFGGLIDLPVELDSRSLNLAVNELCRADHDTRVLMRDGRRYIQRVTPYRCSVSNNRFPSDASYLIVGGQGYIGRYILKWLHSAGVRHAVIVSRSNRGETGGVDELTTHGMEIVHIKADVGDRLAMEALLSRWSERFPPLRGIVHAAGVDPTAPIERVTSIELEAAFQAKVRGAWLLHQLTMNTPLDFFVCFSSATSVWGSKNSSAYAAANAFLDSLARHRRSLGLVGLSINWGPWAGGGMAAAQSNLYEAIGLRLIEPRAALQCLGALCTSEIASAICVSADWSTFASIYGARKGRGLLRELCGVATSPVDPRPKALPLSESDIIRWLRAQIAELLSLEDICSIQNDIGFFEMGLDSLVVIELRDRIASRLGISISQSAIFNHATIESLAEHLHSKATAA